MIHTIITKRLCLAGMNRRINPTYTHLSVLFCIRDKRVQPELFMREARGSEKIQHRLVIIRRLICEAREWNSCCAVDTRLVMARFIAAVYYFNSTVLLYSVRVVRAPDAVRLQSPPYKLILNPQRRTIIGLSPDFVPDNHTQYSNQLLSRDDCYTRIRFRFTTRSLCTLTYKRKWIMKTLPRVSLKNTQKIQKSWNAHGQTLIWCDKTSIYFRKSVTIRCWGVKRVYHWLLWLPTHRSTPWISEVRRCICERCNCT